MWGVPHYPPLGFGSSPPPPSPACCARGAHADWRGPLFGLSVWGTLPLPLLHAMFWERTLLWGCLFVLLLVLSPPPSLSCMLCVICESYRLRGVTPLLRPRNARGCYARPTKVGPLSPLPAHELRTLLSGGSPLLLWTLALCKGRALLCLAVPPGTWLRAAGACCWVGVRPPPSPP